MVRYDFPVSQARPLIEIPKYAPKIGFLGGEWGKGINDSIQEDYKDFPCMQVGSYSDGIVKGSNPFYVVAVQSRLPKGVRVATQGDLETAIRMNNLMGFNILNLFGTYEDSGLVLRKGYIPKEYLPSNLTSQIKRRC